MTNHEKLREVLRYGQEQQVNTERWMVALLSSIAESLAIIADKMASPDKAESEDKEDGED